MTDLETPMGEMSRSEGGIENETKKNTSRVHGHSRLIAFYCHYRKRPSSGVADQQDWLRARNKIATTPGSRPRQVLPLAKPPTGIKGSLRKSAGVFPGMALNVL
jgi:hypothetical protein